MSFIKNEPENAVKYWFSIILIGYMLNCIFTNILNLEI